MSGTFTGRRFSSFSQGSFKICKNSIFDLASCIPSWNTKFDINTVVSRYLSCSDTAANASAATPKLDSCTQLHIKQKNQQENQTLVHMIPINTISYYKYLLLVLCNVCPALKDSEAVIILYKRIDEIPQYRMIWAPLLKIKNKSMHLYPQIIITVKDHIISCTAPAKKNGPMFCICLLGRSHFLAE
jgi:hypothetical protein